MTVADVTQERIGRNEATFRRANEIVERAAATVDASGPISFICECSDILCTESVRLTREEYLRVREHPRRFVTLPGHQEQGVRAGAGEVVEEHDGYVVTEKTGPAGEVAEQLYPHP